ncbi:MAG: hypothetical protein MK226_13965 [Saprospiraceae bacterium]|nr:hypothetical protein [Saprospiraceae bacterium]
MNVHTQIILLLLFSISINAQQGQILRTTELSEPFIDERDGQVYETITYKVVYPDKTNHSFTWMASNLNYAMDSSYCYDNIKEHCETYGRLYTWEAANEACPNSWHLPSDEEWYLLAFHFGGNCKCGDFLKSDSTLWKSPNSRGTNESMFNAIPSGLGSKMNTYYRIGWMAIFWSSNERDENTAWDWKLTSGSELQRWFGSKHAKNSIRCIKD